MAFGLATIVYEFVSNTFSSSLDLRVVNKSCTVAFRYFLCLCFGLHLHNLWREEILTNSVQNPEKKRPWVWKTYRGELEGIQIILGALSPLQRGWRKAQGEPKPNEHPLDQN